VRAFTPLTFFMMSRRQNRLWMEQGANYSMLAFMMDVDFEVEHLAQEYEADWWGKVRRGEMTREALREKASREWNIARELQVRLRAVKDAPPAAGAV
jgi:hypothetical protein